MFDVCVQVACWGAIGVFVLLVVIGLLAGRVTRRWEARMQRYGEEVTAYVMMANSKLFERNSGDGSSYAQVVFVTDPDVPDLEGELQAIAERLKAFQVEDDSDATERKIATMLRTEIPDDELLRLPRRVAGNYAAYTVSLEVHWSKLRKRRLTQGFLQVLIRPDVPKDGCLLLPERGSDQDR